MQDTTQNTPQDPQKETLDALNEDADAFFEAIAYDPYAEADEDAAERAALARETAPCCPCHGPHETDEDGVESSSCPRCEKWRF